MFTILFIISILAIIGLIKIIGFIFKLLMQSIAVILGMFTGIVAKLLSDL